MRLFNISMKKCIRRDHLDVQKIKYAVIDIEATGPNIANGDRIIQIAAIIYQNNEKINEYNMLINPEIAIPPQIAKLTGIEQKDVINAPKLDSVISLWYERLKDCIFIGHNLAFDLRIMTEVFSEFGYSFDPLAIDTFLLSKIIFPLSHGYGLSDLANYLNMELLNAHNALVDARFTSVLVNKIAESINVLPDLLKKKLFYFAEYLPNDEQLIFENPNHFVNNEHLPLIDKETPAENYSDHDDLLRDFILEQWQQQRHLVIENPDFPLKREILYSLAQKISDLVSVVIIVKNDEHIWKWQQHLQTITTTTFKTLKKKHNYLNVQLLEDIEKKIEPAFLNQTELITWMALIHYYEKYQSIDLSEINNELKMFELLFKLAEDYQISIPPNKAYYQQVQTIKQASITIMSIGTFLQLYQRENLLAVLPESATLFFEDAKDLLEIGLYFQQKQIDLSQMLNLLQELLDIYRFNESSYELVDQKVLMMIQELTTKIHQLMLYLEQKEMNEYPSSGKRTRYISKDDTNFIEMIQQILDLNHHLLTYQSSIPINSQLLKNMKKLSLTHQLVTPDSSNYYWSFSGERLHQKLYHVHIEWNQMSWRHDFWLNISEHFDYLLVSPGNYNYKEDFGIYHRLGEPNGDYLKVNEIPKKKITFQIPVMFLSDHLSENKKDIATSNIQTFIKDQNRRKYLIIVSNQEELLDYHRVFSSDEDLLHQYLIQVRGVHGSVRRIINRIKNENSFILIMTINDLQSSQLVKLPDELMILMEKLPFLSPEKPELQAFSDLIQDERLIFDEMNLPMMVQRMKKIMMILGESHDYYLFDDRVFTRTYSNQLQDMLSSLIQFEWKMD